MARLRFRDSSSATFAAEVAEASSLAHEFSLTFLRAIATHRDFNEANAVDTSGAQTFKGLCPFPAHTFSSECKKGVFAFQLSC